ncbi:MAG: hypothetical protein V9G19_23245 [Tetrasphaera sp.]
MPGVHRTRYRTSGDVSRLMFLSPADLASMLEEEAIVTAARRLAIGLMKRGGGLHGRHHSDALADAIFPGR